MYYAQISPNISQVNYIYWDNSIYRDEKVNIFEPNEQLYREIIHYLQVVKKNNQKVVATATLKDIRSEVKMEFLTIDKLYSFRTVKAKQLTSTVSFCSKFSTSSTLFSQFKSFELFITLFCIIRTSHSDNKIIKSLVNSKISITLRSK